MYSNPATPAHRLDPTSIEMICGLAPGVSHSAWLLRGSCFSRDLSNGQRSKHDRVVVLDKTRKLVGFAPEPYC
ncbi:hypothetical protein PsorP6_003349 [Peronosclerospora sorghi]|uniref:Uncharacterized protein n=1 Tax=Peronosclerospora sorghi TaxID=230839 RepID=A0ACC0VSM2_9STRA|nr:hypothetical protein PsorP6_003349 [Peronosclerospora sorghi]